MKLYLFFYYIRIKKGNEASNKLFSKNFLFEINLFEIK